MLTSLAAKSRYGYKNPLGGLKPPSPELTSSSYELTFRAHNTYSKQN